MAQTNDPSMKKNQISGNTNKLLGSEDAKRG